jgi:hypothetical protein
MEIGTAAKVLFVLIAILILIKPELVSAAIVMVLMHTDKLWKQK